MNAWVQQRRGAYVVLFFCTFLTFHNSFENSFHYDDEHSIQQNPHIRSLTNIPTYFVDAGAFSGMSEARMYRPLLISTFAINYAIGEYEVFGYHLINFLFHLINAWLLWEVGLLLLGRRAALWAALIFAVHPLMSEPVNYISSRSSLMATAFYLGAFWLVLQARAQGMTVRKQVLLAACFLGGLLCKSIAITFPVLAGIYLWMQGGQRHWRWLAIPALLGALYVLGTRAIIGAALGDPVRGLAAQWATQIKALVYYLWLGAVPANLSVEPQFSVSSSFADGHVLLAGALLASLLAVLVGQKQKGNVVAFGLYWFFLTLMPSALVPLNVLVNEHRLYLPMVGASLALAALVPLNGFRLKVIALLVFAILCIQRNETWENEEVLWADAVAKGPAMARPYVNLGKAYLEQMRLEESIKTSLKALELDSQLDRAYYNIGTAYLMKDQFELADAHFLRALELRPNLFAAYNNLGNSYKEQKRYADALEIYRSALKLQEHTQVYHNMGAVWLAWGKVDSAAAAFRRAIDVDPMLLESYKGLAKAYSLGDQLHNSLAALQEAAQRWPDEEDIWWLTGRVYAVMNKEDMAVHAYRRAGLEEGEVWLALGDEARKRRNWGKARGYYRRAQQEGCDDARVQNALGETFYGEGNMTQALRAFQQAARLDSTMPVPFTNIGRIYLRFGRFSEAIAAMTRAVELQQDDGGLRALLAEAYRGAGKVDEAIEEYQRALQLAPHVAEYYYNLGFIFEQSQQMHQAESLYEAALARQPHLPQGLFSLATLRLDQRRYSEAEVLLERLVQVQPNHAKAYFNLANAQMHLGKETGAIQSYRRFLSLHVEDGALHRVAERNLEQLLKSAQD